MNMTQDQVLYAAAIRGQLTQTEQQQIAARLSSWMKWSNTNEYNAIQNGAALQCANRQIASLKGVITRMKKKVKAARIRLGEIPDQCEGCKKPAVTTDSEGVPLCATCAQMLNMERPTKTNQSANSRRKADRK